MKVSTLLIVLEFEKSGPGMAARRTQASWRAKAVLMMRTSKALGGGGVSIGMPVCGVDSFLLSGKTHVKATKVKVKRSSSHLSVCGTARDFLPKDVVADMSVDLEPSILRKLATLRTYLNRMATMQTLPTAQQQSTGYSCVSWMSGGMVSAIETYLGCKLGSDTRSPDYLVPAQKGR